MTFFFNLFRKFGYLFLRIADIFARHETETQKIGCSSAALPETDQRINSVVQSWFDDKGDETLRLDYDLNKNSIVFDVGGYKGDWATNIFIKYACNIYIFEPIPIYAEAIKKRFSPNAKIKIFTVGLGSETKEALISAVQDGSSLYRLGDIQLLVQMKSALDFFAEENIKYVDLMKINIEGGEYDLLDHLISSGLVTFIKNIQIQFHRDFPNAEGRMNKIQQGLAQTHSLSFQYRFVWENWKLNREHPLAKVMGHE